MLCVCLDVVNHDVVHCGEQRPRGRNGRRVGRFGKLLDQLEDVVATSRGFIDPHQPRKPRVGIVGEIFCRLNTFSNENLVQTLEGYGVTHIFIVPAIFQQAMAAIEKTSITRVTTHHEMAAAFMADVYARLTGKPGICEGPSGGGATYLLPGVAEAHGSSVPLIALTGNEARMRGRLMVRIDDWVGNLKRIIHLDAEVSDRALQLGMAKQELNGSEVLRALVDQCGLGTSHRVCPVGR